MLGLGSIGVSLHFDLSICLFFPPQAKLSDLLGTYLGYVLRHHGAVASSQVGPTLLCSPCQPAELLKPSLLTHCIIHISSNSQATWVIAFVRVLDWAVALLGSAADEQACLPDILMSLAAWEARLMPDARAAWLAQLTEAMGEVVEDATEPPAKRRHSLYTETGGSRTGGGSAAAASATGGAAAADGSAEPSADPNTPGSGVLLALRERSRQLTFRFLGSPTVEKTADRLLAMLQSHAIVLRVHALRLEGIDATLNLKLHSTLWEAAIKRLGADAATAARYYVCLVDIATSLFAVPQCAHFTTQLKSLMASVAALPWLCSEDALAAAASDAHQALHNVTSVVDLQTLWRATLRQALTEEQLVACVYAMALVPAHSSSNVPYRMLLSVCQLGTPVQRAAAIRTVPFFLACCRRHQKLKVDYGEFAAPLRPAMTSTTNPPEVKKGREIMDKNGSVSISCHDCP